MAIERQPYPFGWSQNGEMVNHNNYDLAKVTLLREPLDGTVKLRPVGLRWRRRTDNRMA
jgi:hypothetical protein